MNTRNQLKQEICSYFLSAGVTREALPKAIAAFKECAEEGRDFSDFFAPQHHSALNAFQKRYWAIDQSPLFAPAQGMTKADADMVFADPQSSPSLLKEAAKVLGC